jgi:hypothetical protein
MGISGGGGRGSQQGGARPGSPKNINKNNKKSWWEAKKKADGNGTSQVPVAAAQPSGSGGGQNAQLSQIAAAGAYNQRGPGAGGQNVQANQNNQYGQYGGWQAAVQVQQGGQSGQGSRGSQQPKPFQCRVKGCRDTNWHNWGDCLIFRSMTMPQRWTMVARSNTCAICLKHGKQVECWDLKRPRGAPPCVESGCIEIHHPLLHEQRGWHGLQGTLWEDAEPEEEQLVEETMVEQDVSVGDLHTQDHTAFSSVEPINKTGEVVPLLLIDGTAPSSEIEKIEENKNVKSFAIKEYEENVECEIVKSENEKNDINSEESSEPDVVDAVGSGAIYTVGTRAGAVS